MAKSAIVTVGNSAPVLLYSGDGAVMFYIADSNLNDTLLLGGSDLTHANGMPFTVLSIAKMFPLRISSDDEIYGLMKVTGAGTSVDVTVFSAR